MCTTATTTATTTKTEACVYCDDAGSTACTECTKLVKAEKLGICVECKTLWYTPDEIHCDCWAKSIETAKALHDEETREIEDEENEGRSPSCPNWR